MYANAANMQMVKDELIFPELSYKINGLLFSVHNELGRYCNEKQYGDYLEELLKKATIKYQREFIVPPSFEGEIPGRNRVDFIIDNKIVLEMKSKRFVEREDYYQVKRYLTALNRKLGLLVNFRQKFLQPKRILNSRVSE